MFELDEYEEGVECRVADSTVWFHMADDAS